MPDPRGAKGAHAPPPPPPPPEATASHTLPPEKKVKRHAKNWYKCESNTCAFTECKNGRVLVEYDNLRLLIRDQTTPHCDARNSKCQIELWGERRNITPGNETGVSCPQTKTNTFVYTLRMFHKISFVWHRPLPCSGRSVSRKINLEPFLVNSSDCTLFNF